MFRRSARLWHWPKNLHVSFLQTVILFLLEFILTSYFHNVKFRIIITIHNIISWYFCVILLQCWHAMSIAYFTEIAQQKENKRPLPKISTRDPGKRSSSFSLFNILSKTISRVMSLDGHLSRPSVTGRLKRPTRKQTGRLMLPVWPCFEWGLHVPSLLPLRR